MAVVSLPLIYQGLAQFLLKRSFTMTLEYLWIYRKALLVGTVFLVLVTAAITVLTRRVVIGTTLTGTIIYGLSTAHFFKLFFREESLMPSDLLLIKEAGIVAGEMKLFLTSEILFYGIVLTVSELMLFRIKLPKSVSGFDFPARLALAGILIFSTALYTKNVIYNDAMLEKIGASMGSLSNEDTYYKGTFVTAFLRFTQDMFYEEPDGYSKDTVRELYENMPVNDKTQQKKPDIIVVMLEGYFHLDNYENEDYSVDLTENYDRLSKEGITGRHLAGTFGGGTADIEFEALTGYSKKLLPDIGTAYNTVIKNGFDSYVSFLKSADYKTIALHSYLGTLYNRTAAYRNMGFDEFYDLDDFTNPDMAGQYISDKGTMDKIIEIYENETASSEGNVFIHAVTMQNHAPIAGRFTDTEKVEVYSERLDENDRDVLADLATCQYLTDKAIGHLTDYFRNSDRDVIVLFFGDHQTKASREQNADPLQRTDFYDKYSKADQSLKLHEVPFLMWSNFENNSKNLGYIGTDALLANMLVEYNVIRPDYFDYVYNTQSVIKAYIPSVQLVVNPDGKITYGLSDEQEKTRLERSYIEYDAVLGKKIIKEYYYN
ncbi:MAG: LTA synthase family protein [Oscillospiraceae bacterium]|nr:LTA synthase family protein [Oscillospiraceae bacterium]